MAFAGAVKGIILMEETNDRAQARASIRLALKVAAGERLEEWKRAAEGFGQAGGDGMGGLVAAEESPGEDVEEDRAG